MNVKGLEIAAYEPRGAVGQGLGYAVANRGGCHLGGGYGVALEGLALQMDGRSPKGKAALVVLFQDLMEAISSAGSCLFTTLGVMPGSLVATPGGALGRSAAILFRHASVVLRLLRIAPRGLLRIPMPLIPHIRAIELATGERYGFGGGGAVPLESLKRDYYRQRGWSKDGLPDDALMTRLGTGGRKPRAR